jgi:cell division protein FtsL
MQKAISFLLAFIFVSITLVIISFKQETDKLNSIIKKDKVLIDSLKGELDIEIFEKSRYISIVDQVSELNCKEVKEIINGTE